VTLEELAISNSFEIMAMAVVMGVTMEGTCSPEEIG
jgi:hypothetical protein